MGPLAEQPTIHVIDFEGSSRSGIVEFGIVSLDGSAILETATELCRPTGRISKQEQDAHGISLGEIDATGTFAAQWERMASLRESGVLCAHFASAENSMLKSVFPYARTSKDWIRDEAHTTDWGPWLDTGALFKEVTPAGQSLKLGDLIGKRGLQEELDELANAYCPEKRRRYHAALYDALASALLLIDYCSEYRAGEVDARSLAILSRGSGDSRQSAEQGRLF